MCLQLRMAEHMGAILKKMNNLYDDLAQKQATFMSMDSAQSTVIQHGKGEMP